MWQAFAGRPIAIEGRAYCASLQPWECLHCGKEGGRLLGLALAADSLALLVYLIDDSRSRSSVCRSLL